MSHRSSFFIVIVLILLISGSVRAQEPAVQRTSEENAARKRKAVELLQLVASQIPTLHSPENRSRIGSNVAELLWDYDEKRARSIFVSVAADIRAGFDDNDADDSARRHTLLVFGQLRGNILDRIAKHDPELALEFLRATRPPPDEQLPYEMRDGEKVQELRLAGLIAGRNPHLALKLGLQSLAKGLSGDLLPVLAQLQETNKDAARNFYQAIVDKLKTTNLAQDYLAMELILNLAQTFGPPGADEQVYRELIGVMLTSALANGCGKTTREEAPPICFQFGQAFSKIEKYYGARAAPLKPWAEESQIVDESTAEEWGKFREVMEKGTVDEILGLSEKYPGMEMELYSRAIDRAKASGDFARARRLASEFPDEARRSELLTEIDREQALKSVDANHLGAIQEGLNRLRTTDEQIRFLFYAASQIKGRDRKAALALLNQAGQILDAAKPGKSQLEGRLALAMAYSALKSDRGFGIIEALMPRLNELVSAAAVLDGVDNNYLRDGEWTMTSAGGVGSLLTQLAQGAGLFVEVDFDRSVALAGQFERPELRLMAVSKIAQAILSGQSNPDSTRPVRPLER